MAIPYFLTASIASAVVAPKSVKWYPGNYLLREKAISNSDKDLINSITDQFDTSKKRRPINISDKYKELLEFIFKRKLNFV